MIRISTFLLALSAMSVAAAQPPAATGAIDSDRLAAFRAVKMQVLQAEAAYELQSHPALTSSSKLTRVYIGGAGSGLELKRVVFALDGASIFNVEMEPAAAHILEGGAPLLWLADVNLAGPHQLHAELVVHNIAKPDAPEQTLAFDQGLEDGTGISTLTIRPVRGRIFSQDHVSATKGIRRELGEDWLALTVRKIGELRADTTLFSPGTTDDPELAYATYLRLSGDGDAAAVHLLAIPLAQSSQADLAPGYWLKMAEALREGDLPDQSEIICNRLDRQNQEKQAVGVERLRDGLLEYDEGNTPMAELQFQSARPRLPDDRLQDWQLAYAQILFDRGDLVSARKILQDRDKEATEAFRYSSQMSEAVLTTAIRHYNLAVAMVKTGEEQQGLSLLDIVGRMKSFDPDLLALRDKANIALGWHFLEKKQGTTAMGILGRVRSEGEFSNKALLGMGWAQLAPGGEPVSRVRFERQTESSLTQLPAPLKHSLSQLGAMDPEMGGEIGPRSFEEGDPPDNKEEGLHRALHLWRVLADRQGADPAVQEGRLAIGYAYDNLRQDLAARDAYSAAIDSMETAKHKIDEEAARIRAGSVSDSVAGASSDSAVAFRVGDEFLSPGTGNRPLYNTIGRLRALDRLRTSLAAYNGAPASAEVDSSRARELNAAISDEYATQTRMIEPIALLDLYGRRDVLDAYLKAAYFASARASDRALRVSAMN
jgi:hypothetical protein